MDEELSMQGNLEINKKEGYVLVSVNPKIYPVDVVLSSAYIFTDNCYVLVDGDPNEEIIVELRPKDKKEDIEIIGRNFNNELINYANYAVQAIKNERLREAILNRVLLTNSVEKTGEVIENKDYLEKEAKPWKFDDPEKIAVPWDEKYGESKNKQSKE
jgi:His-Xaa-Ser system protein HxsD